MSTESFPAGKPKKQWSVSTVSVANDALQLFCGDTPLTQRAPATLDDVSPVEHFLMSVATCFALSCRAALTMKKMPPATFDVNVTGTKAANLPSRLQSVDIVVVVREGLSSAAAAAMTADASRLCTVTNTLHGAPLTISVDTRAGDTLHPQYSAAREPLQD